MFSVTLSKMLFVRKKVSGIGLIGNNLFIIYNDSAIDIFDACRGILQRRMVVKEAVSPVDMAINGVINALYISNEIAQASRRLHKVCATTGQTRKCFSWPFDERPAMLSTAQDKKCMIVKCYESQRIYELGNDGLLMAVFDTPGHMTNIQHAVKWVDDGHILYVAAQGGFQASSTHDSPFKLHYFMGSKLDSLPT